MTSIEQLRQDYETSFGKPVPNNKKNDANWIQSKLPTTEVVEPITEVVMDDIISEKQIEAILASPVAIILDGGKNVVRVYTPEDHGENYMELAKGFAFKNNYTIN